jgi:hypothetical protein
MNMETPRWPQVHHDNTAPIIAAARHRHELTRARAIQAIRELDRAGSLVTFAGLAGQAGISRSWLYSQPGSLGGDRHRGGPGGRYWDRISDLLRDRHGGDRRRRYPLVQLVQSRGRVATLPCICAIVPAVATTRAPNRSANSPAANQ